MTGSRPESGLARYTRRGGLVFQILAFLLVGGVQVLVDTLVFIGLGALGVGVIPANVAGRIAGACFGFALNSRVTFASADGHGMNRRAFTRFVLVWITLTTIGTTLLVEVESRFGLTGAWFAKPAVEAFLAVLGFVALKFVVFPRRRPR